MFDLVLGVIAGLLILCALAGMLVLLISGLAAWRNGPPRRENKTPDSVYRR